VKQHGEVGKGTRFGDVVRGVGEAWVETAKEIEDELRFLERVAHVTQRCSSLLDTG
jgi:hypothetical protein